MLNFKNIVFLLLYTSLFLLLLFLAQSIFFSKSSEDIHTEPSLTDDFKNFDIQSGYYTFSSGAKQDREALVMDLIRKKYEQEKQEASSGSLHAYQIEIHTIPWNIQEKIALSHLPILEAFLLYPDISKSVEILGVYLYEQMGEVRGRMRGYNIHLFEVLERSPEELLSILIHEFWHYFDIHTLEKSVFWDESQKFYDISWESQSVIKKQLLQTDFVSGYAMSNQYEDFAESYVYYILHNRDFFIRSQSSTLLREKYEFFEKYVFSKKQFYKEDFWSDNEEPKPYYWDITKLPIDIKKFLQYLQSSI